MSATVFHQGADELATLTNTFSVAGSVADPTTVTLAVTSPSGTTTTYTYPASITKSSTGVYTKDIACSEADTWEYVWTGTGTASDVVAGTWTVLTTDLQRLYCSVEELKSRLAIGDTVDDFEIRIAIEAACRGIEDYCDRHFWRGSYTRTFVPEPGNWYGCLKVDDLVSITTLKTDEGGDGTFEQTWSASDYQLLPLNATARVESRPYTEIRALARTWPAYGPMIGQRDDRVEITGIFGWPKIPVAVKQACLILSADTFGLKDAKFGVQAYGDFAMRIRDNPRAQSMLKPYRRNTVLVG
jgi:hypothetical protein